MQGTAGDDLEDGNRQRGGRGCDERVQRGLAVKVIRKGATEALGDVERSVMWEVPHAPWPLPTTYMRMVPLCMAYCAHVYGSVA